MEMSENSTSMTCCVQNEATAESLLRYSIDRHCLKSANLKRKLQLLNLLLPFVKFCSGLTIPHSNEISGSHVKQASLSNHSFSVNSDSNWLWPFQSLIHWKWTVVHFSLTQLNSNSKKQTKQTNGKILITTTTTTTTTE